MVIKYHLRVQLKMIITTICKNCGYSHKEVSDFNDARKRIAIAINFSINGTTVLVETDKCFKCPRP